MDAAALSFADIGKIIHLFDKFEESYAIMITRRLVLTSAACSGLVSSFGLAAKPRTYTVDMVTTGSGADRSMVFTPRILRVAVGSSVTFRPGEPTHNCTSTPGMLPPGVKPWTGAVGKPVTVDFDRPGYFGYHCLPHRSMGMVGLIIVGNPKDNTNLEAARAVKHPGKSSSAWQEIWGEIL
jgi:pseudoazurin